MLQNRVDPMGKIIRTPARGAWMGNRGLLHNEHQEIQRSFRLKAWITCVLEFKERKRSVMSPGLYTELFFLDEATSFSAGHRPCFECRREDAVRFKSHWITGNPAHGFDMKTPINQIDQVIHAERIDERGEKVTYTANLSDLPMGTFIRHAGQLWVLRDDGLFPWSPFGYGPGIALPAGEQVVVLTPKSVVNAFRSGYSEYLQPTFKSSAK